MTLWFATGNEHKYRELSSILRGHYLRMPKERGIDFEVDETGTSFLENALLKGRALYHLVHEPVVADDSGLCVDALGGRPGIYSARYGGPNGERGNKKLSSEERNELLLQELGNTPQRSARFVCSMVLFLNEYRFFTVQETLEGTIVRQGRGTGGFGYDPLLYLNDRGKTVAELSEDEKNTLSHRAKAAQRIMTLIDSLGETL
jgi:XTP/dITP diphosphohydrolase